MVAFQQHIELRALVKAPDGMISRWLLASMVLVTGRRSVFVEVVR
jgi:hypothetical protein